MKFARIINHIAVDVRTESPEGCFTQNIVAEFVQVQDEVQDGWSNESGAWAAPVVPEQATPEPAATVPPTVGAIAFMRLFTSDERVKARQLRSTDLKLDDFWMQLEDPRTDVVVMAIPSIQADIEYTLNALKNDGMDIDVAMRKAEILLGQVL